MSGGFERIIRISRKVETNPWEQPDMRLRDNLYSPGEHKLAVISIGRIQKFLNISDPRDVRTLLREMGGFTPIGKDRGANEWTYTPADLLPVGGKPEPTPIEPHRAGRMHKTRDRTT